MSETDMILIDTNLVPNHTYTYQAQLPAPASGGRSLTAYGSPLQVRTMDTTSHAWTFTTTILGDGSSSVLYDVAIINDTCVWAVGEIYQDGVTYNAAKWDGQQWVLERILYPYQGQQYYGQLHSIFVFSGNDLWVGSNQPMHWNGSTWQTFDLSATIWNGWINKMWGSSSYDFYIVGNSGAIAHYTSSSWTKIESGTTASVNDIWGEIENGASIIYGAATNISSAGERTLLKITSSNVTKMEWQPQQQLSSVWFMSQRKMYIGGGGLFTGTLRQWKEIFDLPLYFSNKIRGTGNNNVWVVGAYGLCGHFNGKTWHSYQEVALPNGTYEGLTVSSSTIIAVGQSGSQAVVTIGRRN
jgi:hypothetical protein